MMAKNHCSKCQKTSPKTATSSKRNFPAEHGLKRTQLGRKNRGTGNPDERVTLLIGCLPGTNCRDSDTMTRLNDSGDDLLTTFA